MQVALFLLPLALFGAYAAAVVLCFPRAPPPVSTAPQRHHPIVVNPAASVEAELDIELSDPGELESLFREARSAVARAHPRG